ncbi:PUA-like domain-containing protein [Panaeolus papilionaceus]|nr:PUA-like domain-containing protein [Panaeolus papilionaceus]
MTERMRAKLMGSSQYFQPVAPVDPRFGNIPGIKVGDKFASRKECSAKRVHTKTVAGISGSKDHGAYSIVLNGGYEDDNDEGETFVYTGTGGQKDPYASTSSQVCDQSFTHNDNAALYRSWQTQRPVRVIRGPNAKSFWAPNKGYRYDGLYVVTYADMADGVSGYKICQYKLRRVAGQPPLPRKSVDSWFFG